MPDKWLEPENYKKTQRLTYIIRLQADTISLCPECDTTLETDECTVYCPRCGLVVADSYPYVAGFPVNYAYGLKLG